MIKKTDPVVLVLLKQSVLLWQGHVRVFDIRTMGSSSLEWMRKRTRHQPLVVISTGLGKLTRVHADHRRIATGGYDKKGKVWDFEQLASA